MSPKPEAPRRRAAAVSTASVAQRPDASTRLARTRASRVRDASPPEAAVQSLVARIEAERSGVASQAVERLRRALNMPIQEFGETLGIGGAATKKRFAQNALFKGSAAYAVLDLGDMLQAVGDVIAPDARETFDVEAWFADWIRQPQPALGGEPPARFMDTPTGREVVKRLIGAIGSGAYL